MAANLDLTRASEPAALRGFANLFRKERDAWTRTPRGWVNALLWTALLCGLTAIMLFGPNEELKAASAAEIAALGSELNFTLSIGLTFFLEFGITVLAIGIIILMQDLIVSEAHDGLAEWLLSKPITRRAYILSKLAANALAVLVVMIALPALITYGILSLRLGAAFPLLPYLAAVGIMIVHSLFYLTLTLLLGTLFSSRGPILGIALAMVLGGNLIGNFFPQLFYVTPWMLPKIAWLTATAQPAPAGMVVAPLLASLAWSIAFILLALVKFQRAEC